MKKTQITFEQHQEIGKNLKEIILTLQAIEENNLNFSPRDSNKNTVKASNAISSAITEIRSIRDYLDEILFNDFPEQENTSIYYGITG